MGAKISTIQGVVPLTVQDGKISVTDKLGVVYEGDISCDFEVQDDDTFYKDLLFADVSRGDRRFVCRYDGTWSLYRKSNMELLDMGAFNMKDPSILEVEYETIGYYLNRGVVYSLVLDMHNKRLVHALSNEHVASVKDFVFNSEFTPDNLNLLIATTEAHNNMNIVKSEIYIYTQYGRLRTEEMLHALSGSI